MDKLKKDTSWVYDCNKSEVQRRFEEIIEKKLNKKFISSGDLIRFRDSCIEQGKLTQAEEMRKDELKWLNENRHTINGIDVLEVDKRIEQLKKEITGENK